MNRADVLSEVVDYLNGRADSLERSGNRDGAYEARNCALAVERMDEQRQEAA